MQKKGKGQVPLKKNSPKSNIEKYGGYTNATSTFFAFVSYTDEKGKCVKAFVPVDLYAVSEYNNDPVGYVKTALEKMGAKAEDVSVLISRIKYNQLLSIDGFRMHISAKCGGGRTITCKPAMQLILSPENEKYVKRLTGYMDKCAEYKTEKPVTAFDGITAEENLELYRTLTEKIEHSILKVKFMNTAKTLKNGEEQFQKLSLYQQCYVLLEVFKILHCNAVVSPESRT